MNENCDGRPTLGFSLIELLIVIGIVAILVALLVPSLAGAREQAKRVACLSNQRQIALAIGAYAQDSAGRFPIAQYFDVRTMALVAWDTTTLFHPEPTVRPGLIWEHEGNNAVQQCPSYEGPSMTSADPFTGYNYNTTYIGRGQGEGEYLGMTDEPALVAHVRFAATAALVGDGGFASGANKFMRAPMDKGVGEGVVLAGAQAFRHSSSTNVVYIDGHAESGKTAHDREASTPALHRILDWPGNGFLSKDDANYAHR